MLPYQAVAMDYAVSSGFQRQTPIGLGVNINPAFTHSWFVPADLCVTYKQTPLLEPGHVNILLYLLYRTTATANCTGDNLPAQFAATPRPDAVFLLAIA